MNKRQAERLTAEIRKDDNAGATVLWVGPYNGGRWEIDLQDADSGYNFTIGSPQDWKDRQEAKESAAQHGA